jgi:hypothetical protein
MLQPIASAIQGPDATTYAWRHSPSEIVTAVEQVFSAIKEREDQEGDLLEDLWETIKFFAEVAGGVLETPILVGAVAAFAPFAAIGAGYAAAAEEIKMKRATMGYAEGLVMGVVMEATDNISDYFWEHQPTPNPAFEYGALIAQYYYNGALVLGYGHGRQVLAKNLAGAFWTDTKRYMTTEFGNPEDGWGRQEWIDFYITTASAFLRGHITEE